MFKKVLIANRGEIALRVIKTCKKMGIATVAVYSDADAEAPFAKEADEAHHIGGSQAAESYLNAAKILQVAKQSGAEAVHPGYGFLSENTHFAAECKESGIVFIGPSSHAIEHMGDKATARTLMEKAGVPCVPGSDATLEDAEEAKKVAAKIGYPVLLKASAGGGGIGMVPVPSEDKMEKAFETASSRALKAFGSGAMYIEKLIQNPHHIEVQVMGDTHGNVVHFFERECSIQRRNQKVIEESPAPLYKKLEGGEAMLEKLYETAVAAAKSVEYDNAGTIEFIADDDGNYYFIEMNTRLQVEHGVTELVTGTDLVELQLRVAAGEELPIKQSDIKRKGAAIECRICAENPKKMWFPAPGKIEEYTLPEGEGVRVDNGVNAGYTITPFYDSMVAKLLAYGETRDQALDRAYDALGNYKIVGLTTNLAAHRRIIRDEKFRAGVYTTAFLEGIDWKNEELEEL
ncbi:MAG: acetyl-CoA carboxylase biotin carboxylase subunit [Chrysiogenetes bacterium]|nr:acetyl-CoA carboxylase biotin carboxylase subunit [Chrysiogenetes bacterium]